MLLISLLLVIINVSILILNGLIRWFLKIYNHFISLQMGCIGKQVTLHPDYIIDIKYY